MFEAIGKQNTSRLSAVGRLTEIDGPSGLETTLSVFDCIDIDFGKLNRHKRRYVDR